jgi:hypothetical protein
LDDARRARGGGRRFDRRIETQEFASPAVPRRRDTVAWSFASP